MATKTLTKALTAAALGLGTVAGATAATAAPVQQVPARTAAARWPPTTSMPDLSLSS